MTEFINTKDALRDAYSEQRRICRMRLMDLKNLLRYATDDHAVAALRCALETEERFIRSIGELESTIQRIMGTA